MKSALKGIKTIEELDIENKVVFIRCDLNVPMKDGEITDDFRLKSSLPTIRYAIDQGAKVVIGSHLGRPKTEEDHHKFTLEPVANRLSIELNTNVYLVEDPLGEGAKGLLSGLKKGELLLLENLRFISTETKNGPELAQAVGEYADVYINDAFGASHRSHSSIVSLAQAFETRGIGLLMQKEISMLEKIVHSPDSPFFAILGGAKVSDKIEILDRLVDKVDGIFIGGAMAYTFLKARGDNVGNSLVEEDKLNFAKSFFERMKLRDKTVYLPVDHVVAKSFSSLEHEIHESIPDDFMALDIGPKTIQTFTEALSSANTVFWNGPMGVFERSEYSKGTFALAELLAGLSATTVVGGGDSAAAAIQSGYSEKLTHISTGGGASLEFLQGVELPGLLVLKNKLFE